MAKPNWFSILLDLFSFFQKIEPFLDRDDAAPKDESTDVPEDQPPTGVEPPPAPDVTYVPPTGVQTTPPFKEDISKCQLVIDARQKLNASGLSTMSGKGWVRRAEAGLINGDQHYITRFTEDGTERVMWSPRIPKSGKYEVWVSYRSSENRTTAATFTVVSRTGRKAHIVVNQREPGAGGPRYKMIGIFPFEVCKPSRTPAKNYIYLQNKTRGTSESVDAVLLRKV